MLENFPILYRSGRFDCNFFKKIGLPAELEQSLDLGKKRAVMFPVWFFILLILLIVYFLFVTRTTEDDILMMSKNQLKRMQYWMKDDGSRIQ